MKQRVQDLERQLCEMRTRQQQQQYFTREYSVTDGHIPFHASAGNLPPQSWQQQPTTYPMSPDIWPPIPSQTPHYQAHDGTAMAASALMSHSFPPQPCYNDSTLMNNMQALGSASQSPNVVLQSDIELQHSSPMRLYTEEPTVGFISSEQAHFSPRKHQSAAESGRFGLCVAIPSSSFIDNVIYRQICRKAGRRKPKDGVVAFIGFVGE